MGCLIIATAVINEVQHICGETKSIAELFDEYADIDDKEGRRKVIGEIYIYNIRQCDGAYHWPEPFPKSVLTRTHSTENTSESKTNNTYGALYKTVFLW